MYKPAIIQLLFLLLPVSGLTQEQGNFHRYHAGFHVGFADSITVTDRYTDAEIDNSGYYLDYVAGYHFNQSWSIEVGYVAIEDIDLVLIAGDDISMQEFSVTGIYTIALGNGPFYFKSNLGLGHFRIHADDRTRFFGYELLPKSGEQTYDASGTSVSLSAAIGVNLGDRIKWNILNAQASKGDHLEWISYFSGLTFHF